MSGYNPFDLAGRQEAEEDCEAALRRDRAEAEGDFKWLMGSRRGRKVVWRLLESSGVFRTSFSTDALQMAFNEGTRNYGLQTLRMIQALCPALYPTMLKEQTDDTGNTDG